MFGLSNLCMIQFYTDLATCTSYYLNIDAMSGIKEKKHMRTGPVKRIKKCFLDYENFKAEKTQTKFSTRGIYYELEDTKKKHVALFTEKQDKVSLTAVLNAWLHNIVPRSSVISNTLTITTKDYFDKTHANIIKEAINGIMYKAMLVPESLGFLVNLANTNNEDNFAVLNMRGSKSILTEGEVTRVKKIEEEVKEVLKETENKEDTKEEIIKDNEEMEDSKKKNELTKEDNIQTETDNITTETKKDNQQQDKTHSKIEAPEMPKIKVTRKEIKTVSDYAIEEFILDKIKEVVRMRVKEETNKTVSFHYEEDADFFCGLTEFKNQVILNINNPGTYTHPFIWLMKGNEKESLINAIVVDLKILRDEIINKFKGFITLETKAEKIYIYSRFYKLVKEISNVEGEYLDSDMMLQGCCDVDSFKIEDDKFVPSIFQTAGVEIFTTQTHVSLLRKAEEIGQTITQGKLMLKYVDETDEKLKELKNYHNEHKEKLGSNLEKAIQFNKMYNDLQDLNIKNKSDFTLKDSGIKQLELAIENAEKEGIEGLEEFKEFIEQIKKEKGGGNKITKKVYDLNFKRNMAIIMKKKKEEAKKKEEEAKQIEEEKKEEPEIKDLEKDKDLEKEENIKPENTNEENKEVEDKKSKLKKLMNKMNSLLKKHTKDDKAKDVFHKLGFEGSNPDPEKIVDDEKFFRMLKEAQAEEEEKKKKDKEQQKAEL